MKIVAYTRPDRLTSVSDPTVGYTYDRVAALWHDDGAFGQHLGETAIDGLAQTELNMSTELGRRLMKSFGRIILGEEVSCYDFWLDMSADRLGIDPLRNATELKHREVLAAGALGCITVDGQPVHYIGYALGDGTSLQVMSAESTLGFAPDDVILEFYRQVYRGYDVKLHQYSELQSPDRATQDAPVLQ